LPLLSSGMATGDGLQCFHFLFWLSGY